MGKDADSNFCFTCLIFRPVEIISMKFKTASCNPLKIPGHLYSQGLTHGKKTLTAIISECRGE